MDGDRDRDRDAGRAGPGDFLRRALERARGLLELGRPRAALGELHKAVAAGGAGGAGGSGGPPAEALQLIGLCHLRLGDLAAARQALESAVASDPADAHGHYLLGYVHSESRAAGSPPQAPGPADHASAELAQALACYREALRLAPEQPVYLRALAEGLTACRQFAPALELAHKAVALGPDRASNHITLGYVASSAGDRQLARRAYQQALELEPNSALAWNNLGCVDLAQGRLLHARERFREALRLDPAGSVAKDNYELVKPRLRPKEIYQDFAALERHLVIEVWETVLFPDKPVPPPTPPLGKGGPGTSAPLSPRQFLSTYLNPFPHRAREEPRLHAAALLWATHFRALPALWWRAPSLLTYLGLSASLLRLGPAGAALALSSGAAAVLLSRAPLRKRYEIYRQKLAELQPRWQRAYADWLAGSTARHQRDAAIDSLIDEFCCFVEAQRDQLPPQQSPAPRAPEL
jgi:Flp pilus assembly protein TadD